MKFKHISKFFNLTKSNNNLFITREKEIRWTTTLPSNNEVNLIPKAYQGGKSAFYIENNNLYYVLKDYNEFYTISKIYHIDQLYNLKEVFEKCLRAVKRYSKPSLNVNAINLELPGKYFIYLSPVSDKLVIKFPITDNFIEMNVEYLKDEIKSITSFIEVYEATKTYRKMFNKKPLAIVKSIAKAKDYASLLNTVSNIHISDIELIDTYYNFCKDKVTYIDRTNLDNEIDNIWDKTIYLDEGKKKTLSLVTKLYSKCRYIDTYTKVYLHLN